MPISSSNASLFAFSKDFWCSQSVLAAEGCGFHLSGVFDFEEVVGRVTGGGGDDDGVEGSVCGVLSLGELEPLTLFAGTTFGESACTVDAL